MKHIKLYESFHDSDYKAISVFREGGSDLYVGVFPKEQAIEIYSQVSSVSDNLVEIIDLPHNHDVVVSELGGEGLSTTNSEDFESLTGESLPPLVKLGMDYELDNGNNTAGIPFYADRSLGAFVGVNGFGGVKEVPTADLIY